MINGTNLLVGRSRGSNRDLEDPNKAASKERIQSCNRQGPIHRKQSVSQCCSHRESSLTCPENPERKE